MADSDLEMWLIESIPREFIVIVQMVVLLSECVHCWWEIVGYALASTMIICTAHRATERQRHTKYRNVENQSNRARRHLTLYVRA